VRSRPTIAELSAGVRSGDRSLLARAITLLESSRPEDVDHAQELLRELLPYTGNAVRVGLSGVPGVGKSTFIDQFGVNLIQQGRRVAVLAIDPSSSRSGGSILGDKTRMERLSTDPDAFIRPSPAGKTLGGVNRVTRESILVCEAAGFDTVIVETVGVGQSETAVADMVDTFCVLMLPGAGDDLQGIKKGIIELADILAVNKADGENSVRADQAAVQYRHALHLLAPTSPNWTTPVLTCSGSRNLGLDVFWDQIQLHRQRMLDSGEFGLRRSAQQSKWMWELLDHRIQHVLTSPGGLAERVRQVEVEVQRSELPVVSAVDEIWTLLSQYISATAASDS
jgi:LAO/AO transport system kinase